MYMLGWCQNSMDDNGKTYQLRTTEILDVSLKKIVDHMN